MAQFDIIVIGAGPGGYETALLAAERGKKVLLVNGGRLGGTCLNAGCIPTKCMVRDAAIVSLMKDPEEFGVANVSFDVDFSRVVERRNKVVSTLREGIDALLKRAKVTVVEGFASFVDASSIRVNEEVYTASDIIIATGSESKSIPVPGADEKWVLDSTDILAIDYIPKSLTIVGGGVIGLEFASVFNAFGSDVTVVEFLKNIAPTFDSDISKRLKQSLSKRGVKVLTGAAVKRIEKNEEGQIVTWFDLKGKEDSVISSDILMAVGRRPNVDGLNLEAAGVEFSPRGIPVDDMMRTNVPHIYAIGDVNARMMLAHVASYQGKRALNAIDGVSDDIRFDVIPAALFTDPECGMVGLTEDAAKEKGINIKVGKSFYRANGKALAGGESDGICKLIFEAESDRLVGAHIMGAEAAILAQQCADFITLGATRQAISDTIFGHPTLSEVVLAAVNSVH
ncbi:MAG: dihydrolipoyl dehydrogenase [Muribaculaceae bacterium]|nr:dihydrolipoyl dehydrogenase [Muribaculaceae bacterium]MCI6494676.1 dihydrolipoyl dehydrogenase [Bacteroidales bacterium]MDY4649406.1 dihydrolipoyl dehydrogenase [Muribaculaceae bacterium]